MALDTYAHLQTALADWLNRTDLTAVIPDLITLAEARIQRELRSAGIGTSTVSIAADDSAFTLPTGSLEPMAMAVSDSVEGGAITTVSLPALLQHRADHPSTGVPEVAHIIGTTVEFSPTSNAAYDILVEYEGPFSALSVTNTSNTVLTTHPDLYLYGSLAESAPYLKDDSRIPVWEGRFQKALQEIERQRDRKRWPAPLGVPMPKTFSGTPPGY